MVNLGRNWSCQLAVLVGGLQPLDVVREGLPAHCMRFVVLHLIFDVLVVVRLVDRRRDLIPHASGVFLLNAEEVFCILALRRDTSHQLRADACWLPFLPGNFMKSAEAFIRFRLFVFHQAGDWVANLRFRSLVRRNLPVFGVGLFL